MIIGEKTFPATVQILTNTHIPFDGLSIAYCSGTCPDHLSFLIMPHFLFLCDIELLKNVVKETQTISFETEVLNVSTLIKKRGMLTVSYRIENAGEFLTISFKKSPNCEVFNLKIDYKLLSDRVANPMKYNKAYRK